MKPTPRVKPIKPGEAKRRNYRAFEISGWLPVPKNKVLGPRGAWLISADKRTVAHFAREFANLNKWEDATEKQFVRVTIVKGPRGKVEDYDNFLYYMKPILDGLTRPCLCSKCEVARELGHKLPSGHKQIGAGLIVDDAPKWCEWDIEMSFELQRAVRVEIWDAD